jgi:hypothetical protein
MHLNVASNFQINKSSWQCRHNLFKRPKYFIVRTDYTELQIDETLTPATTDTSIEGRFLSNLGYMVLNEKMTR